MKHRPKAAPGTLFRRLAFFALATFLLPMCACSKTQFEREHDAAVKDNPWGVELHLKLAGDATKFHPGDTMRFQEFYTAKEPRMWQLEVLDSSNAADVANVAYISDGKVVQQEPYATANLVCCKWRYVTLNTDPVRLPYRFDGAADTSFRSILLPVEPGRYRLYVQTHRLLMRKGDGLDPATHTGYPLTSSELVDIEVLPSVTASR